MLPLNSLLRLTFKLEAFKNTNKMSTETYLQTPEWKDDELRTLDKNYLQILKKVPILGQIYMKEVKKNIWNSYIQI